MRLTVVIEGSKEDRTLQKVVAALNDFEVVSANWDTEKVVPAFTHRGPGGMVGPMNGKDVGDAVNALVSGINIARGRGRS